MQGKKIPTNIKGEKLPFLFTLKTNIATWQQYRKRGDFAEFIADGVVEISGSDYLRRENLCTGAVKVLNAEEIAREIVRAEGLGWHNN